jgi:addiction module HigA family antidote
MTTLGFSIHPGEILREEYLKPLGLKPYTLAKKLNVPRTRIERLAAEQTPVTTDTALRLAKFFGTTPQFWMNMQASYDLATEAAAIKDEIARIENYEEVLAA